MGTARTGEEKMIKKEGLKPKGWAGVPKIKGTHWAASILGAIPQFFQEDGLGQSQTVSQAATVADAHPTGLSQFWLGSVGGTRCVTITNAELAQQLFRKHPEKLCRSKILEFNFTIGLGGSHDVYNIFNIPSHITLPSKSGEKKETRFRNHLWQNQRNAFTAEILSRNLEDYHHGDMVKIINEELKGIDKEFEQETEVKLNLESLDMRIAMTIAAKTLMGVPMDDKAFATHTDEIAELFTQALRKSFNARHAFTYLFNRLFRCGKTEVQKAHAELMAKIEEYFIEPYKEHILKSDSVLFRTLQSLPENIDKAPEAFFDSPTAKSIIAFMLLVGHDTTSRAMQLMTEHLAENDALQQQIFDEIVQFENEGYDVYSPDIVTKLPTLNAVFKEVERLYPGAPQLGYEVVVPFTLDGGELGPLHFEKGTYALIALGDIQRSKKYFPDHPLKFDHTRFSEPEETSPYGMRPNTKSPAYNPFGIGKRACVGYKYAHLEVLIKMVQLIKRYHLRLVKAEKEGELFKCESLGTLRQAGDAILAISKRAPRIDKKATMRPGLN